MALKLTYTDQYNRSITDSYWRIEDVRTRYIANPKEGQSSSMAIIIIKGYPSKEWRDAGKPPFPDGTQKVTVADIHNLSFSNYDELRDLCYDIIKQHPFFTNAVDELN